MADDQARRPPKGRGTANNRSSRFNAIATEPADDGWGGGDEEDLPKLRTEVFADTSRTIISYNDSPDIPFDRSINPYKGCEHGCSYCFARPTHAYLGLSPGLDFETKLFAKHDAAALLARELGKRGYRPDVIALGANTDPYQPIERRLRITRGILQVLHDCAHPVSIVTKGGLIERDLDLLGPMAARRLAQVAVSLTTLDANLSRRLEPRAASPRRRLRTIRALAEAGVPVTVLFAPVIPALNEPELEAVLTAARDAGARAAGYVLLRLPLEVEEIFRGWLEAHEPLKAAHVMSLLAQMRGGKAYQAEFGSRMSGKGVFAQLIAKRFKLACARLGLNERRLDLDVSQFVPPRQDDGQLSLF